MVFSIEREDGGTGRHVGFRFLFARVRVQVPFLAKESSSARGCFLLMESVGLEAMRYEDTLCPKRGGLKPDYREA